MVEKLHTVHHGNKGPLMGLRGLVGVKGSNGGFFGHYCDPLPKRHFLYLDRQGDLERDSWTKDQRKNNLWSNVG